MSARPDVPRLADEDLDLLISRSLDGDLSPEEEQQLERLVSLDPAAARRREEIAALVAEMKALPEPAAPFAISTRVNSNVAERAGRPGSLGGRIGFFPAPGSGKAALVVLFIVGVAIAILRPAPRPRAEGPVDVFLYNPPPAASAPAAAPAPAPASVIAEASVKEAKRPVPRDEARREAEIDEGPRAASNEVRAKLNDELAKSEAAAGAKKDLAASNVPAEQAPGLAGEPEMKQKAAAARSDLDGGFAQAPAKVTGAGAIGAAGSPARAQAPAPAAPTARGWTVSVRGDAARTWSLRRAPDLSPAPASGRAVVFQVTVDATGRVASVRKVSPGAAEPGLDAFVRGMIFEALPAPAHAASDATGKAAPAASEFEIELTPR